MRNTLTLAVAAALVLSSFVVTGPATATGNNQDYEHATGRETEHEPNCKGADDDGDGEGDYQPSGFTIDPNEVDPLDLFDSGDKVPVSVNVPVRGERAVTYCTGEQWDGQDPNTKESDKNSEAGGDADEDLVEPQEGDAYVNPLYDGDCSGWNSDHHKDGCDGGTDKPTFAEVVNARVTVDAPGPSDDRKQASVYVNEEIWGLHRCAYAVGFKHADRDVWAFNMCEDHSDQVVTAVFGETTPVDDSGLFEDDKDGNLQCIPFGIPQGGTCAEGDCTSHQYQHASNDKTHDPENGKAHKHGCTRDNTVFFVGFDISYSWVPSTSSHPAPVATSSPPVLP